VKSLSHHLLGQTRSALLATLLLRPDTALHVRELARVTGASPGSLHRELRSLTALGLLTRQEIGRQVHYRANRDSPVFEDLAGLLRKTSGLADVLRGALAPMIERIAFAFVYGSVASGAERALSDVDVLLLGGLGFGDAVKLLYPAQSALGREINPMVVSVDEWRARLKAKDPFIKEVLARPKIFLVGDDASLATLGRRQLQRT